jgi:hypothetical protein
MTSFPPDLGYELVNPPNIPGSGFRFGRGTVVHVSGSEISSPTIRTDDVSVARADGLMMGREYYDGLTITFDINIKTRGLGDNGTAAKALHRNMAQAWFTEDTGVGASRITPGEVSELYLTDDDRTLVTYGRPRNYQPTRGRTRAGWIPVTATFNTITHKFYEAQWQYGTITSAPSTSTGLVPPFIFPLNTFSVQVLDDFAIVDGNTETWLLTKIYGPISAPKVEITNYYTIETSSDFSLGPNEWLEIDPRPWSRKVMKNGTTPCAGKFTAQSRRISMQTLPPGVHRIVLRGNDPTGTARLETSWRNAWSTW